MNRAFHSGAAGLRSTFLLLTTTLATACAAARAPEGAAPNERDGPIITREEIARSGATTGWEALRWAGTHLTYQHTREGSPVRVTHRGTDSFFIDPQVMLVVDGAHVQDLSILESIPADNIEYIQILSGRVGVVKYGTGGGNGVVVVRTGVPPPKDT